MYRVLIVDDEPLMRQYLRINIPRISPLWMVAGEATDGIQAVNSLKSSSYDLVITDIKMPEMDGLELAHYIHHGYPQTRIVIVSGFDEFDYARRAIRCGVVDYLLKPINDETLSSVLQQLADAISVSSRNHFEQSNCATMPTTGSLSQRACIYINEHYSEPISLALISELLGVTPSYLSDLFHKSVGESYSKYVLRTRMEAAAKLLSNSPNEKIYDIAKHTGFVSPKHFHAVFKRFYGLTPSEFMEKNSV